MSEWALDKYVEGEFEMIVTSPAQLKVERCEAPGTPDAGDAIVIDNVSVEYVGDRQKSRVVLSGVNLRVRRGEFTALVGRSGCGKTSLLNLVSGLVEPSAGSVTIMGESPRQARHRVGFMPARDALLPWRNALRNVEYGLELRGVSKTERRQIALQWLGAVQLMHAQHLWPWQLSQGMRQRVALARTWALDPEVLLMDEPFAALDMTTRQSVQERFLDLWQSEQRKTVIFVTHDLGEAIALADRVVLIGDGRVIDDVTVDIKRPRALAMVSVERRYEEIYRHLRVQLK